MDTGTLQSVAPEVLPEEDNYRRYRSDMLWQTVPHTRSGNREGSVTNGRKSSTADD